MPISYPRTRENVGNRRLPAASTVCQSQRECRDAANCPSSPIPNFHLQILGSKDGLQSVATQGLFPTSAASDKTSVSSWISGQFSGVHIRPSSLETWPHVVLLQLPPETSVSLFRGLLVTLPSLSPSPVLSSSLVLQPFNLQSDILPSFSLVPQFLPIAPNTFFLLPQSDLLVSVHTCPKFPMFSSSKITSLFALLITAATVCPQFSLSSAN